MTVRRTVLALLVVISTALTTLGLSAPPSTAEVTGPRAPLTNLAHLDFLGDRVSPPPQADHTTYRLGEEPSVGVLWTYADRRDTGLYERVGGGALHPDGTWGQGAFNADDVSRASVVYLRHWRLTGSPASRDKAYEMLRGLAYFQTVSGPNAGNVVLWMQPDGTLNPSAFPIELPDPSDSAESYWLARTIWAMGEGYRDFMRSGSASDVAFAGFLRERLDLAVSALQRQTLSRVGQYLAIDGESTPAWLITNGGDATAEAVLGLSAYAQAGAPPAARMALRQLAQALAALGGGDSRNWPMGAVRPWALSRSIWHAWGSQLPAALTAASAVLGERSLLAPAVQDSAVFDPWMLTSGGPDNGRLPTRIDGSQIAYGVDSRLESLVATADVTGAGGLRRLAAMVAAWYFGANASGLPAYDPTTGRTVDGIEADGRQNLNAGAESTIHGLLSMLVLDAHPGLAADAQRTSQVVQRVGSTAVQVETAALGGGATAVAPAALWTGESQYGGTGYAALGNGGTASVQVGRGPERLVQAVVELQPGSSAVTTFRAGRVVLGVVRSGAIGAQGDSPAPGALLPVTLPVTLPRGASAVTASTVASGGDTARLDALMVQPLLSRLGLGGSNGGVTMVHSAATEDAATTVAVSGSGPVRVEVYDGQGQLVSAPPATTAASGRRTRVEVVAGGFSVAVR